MGLRVQGRVGRTHYCARPPQNRTRDFHRIRLKQEGGAVTGPAADARGCCRWALPGFGHDHAVGAALVVLAQLCLLAELDILMLRPEAPGAIISRGDIDNSLKTLLDALRAPNNEQEVGGSARQSSWASPTFTLLEDDRLISRVNVDTDRLLNSADHDQVRLTIKVTLRPSKVIYGNQVLIS